MLSRVAALSFASTDSRLCCDGQCARRQCSEPSQIQPQQKIALNASATSKLQLTRSTPPSGPRSAPSLPHPPWRMTIADKEKMRLLASDAFQQSKWAKEVGCRFVAGSTSASQPVNAAAEKQMSKRQSARQRQQAKRARMQKELRLTTASLDATWLIVPLLPVQCCRH